MTRTAAHAAVVAGVDESEAALAAVRWAAEEAANRRCRLLLFHAGMFDTADLGRHEHTKYAPLPLEGAHRWLKRAAWVAEATAPGVPVEYLVRLGIAGELLVELSGEAELLVLGSHSIGGLRGVAIGSIALRVAASAHCPVVVVRGRVKPDGPVVAGFDGDDRVLEFAFEAAQSRRVPVVAVHAWHEGLMAEPEVAEAAERSERQALRHRVETLSGRYPEVTARSRAVRDHSAAQALMSFDDAQLVVIGTRGRGPVAGGLFGSTGNRLLTQSSCPVAVVH
ncbi:universal stress protein [Amycolatopsis sp. NPDC051903]|uniref:universal stress protein n=1 Tax=Amycolatopsis sp. NPDC051903 TaxID=3363936 RepID=UPI0037873434